MAKNTGKTGRNLYMSADIWGLVDGEAAQKNTSGNRIIETLLAAHYLKKAIEKK